ncbi:MAG: Ig-like domain-containing protein [Lachnospiraceae bacterium]|nr:Ig-like domain-containing protein [Lachnospiraceae bacterium]
MKKYRRIILILFAFFVLCFPPFSVFATTDNVAYVQAAKQPVLNYSSKALLKGDTFKLKLKYVKTSVSFSSQNKKVATVSPSGLVKAKSAGTAIITATCKGKIYRCKVTVSDTVDLIVFAGQSNMTGRGSAKAAPKLIDGAGYESKTVTDNGKLYTLKEPFGLNQDRGSLDDSGLRTGSLVTSFVNAYYTKTKTPVVAVSATIAGSGCVSWSEIHYKEVAARVKQAEKALKKRGIKIDNCYMVYMQGENDGFAKTSQKFYKKKLITMFNRVKKSCNVEKCLLIRIGKYTKDPDLYDDIVKAQTDVCKTNKNFVLVSTKAAALKKSYYQADGIHLTQRGLNILGKEAGLNAASYKLTGTEPSLKDAKYGNTYKPQN